MIIIWIRFGWRRYEVGERDGIITRRVQWAWYHGHVTSYHMPRYVMCQSCSSHVPVIWHQPFWMTWCNISSDMNVLHVYVTNCMEWHTYWSYNVNDWSAWQASINAACAKMAIFTCLHTKTHDNIITHIHEHTLPLHIHTTYKHDFILILILILPPVRPSARTTGRDAHSTDL